MANRLLRAMNGIDGISTADCQRENVSKLQYIKTSMRRVQMLAFAAKNQKIAGIISNVVRTSARLLIYILGLAPIGCVPSNQ